MPLVVTLAPMFDVPETLRFVMPLKAPSMSASPVMVSALPPPTKVLCVLMVEPAKVVAAAKVTAPW